MRRIFIVLLLLSLCGGPAWAGDDDAAALDIPSPEDVAAEVLEAIATEDKERLGRLAARDNPDPWLVADALDALGHRAEAQKFAVAAPRADTRAMVAHLLVAPPSEALAPQRKRLAQAEIGAADPAAVLKQLDALPDRPTIPMARLHHLRGQALFALRRFADAAAAFATSGALARKIGWLGHASEAYYQAGQSHFRIPDFEANLVVFEQRLKIEQRLGSDMGQGRAHFGLFVVHDRLGNGAEASEHLQRARAFCEKAGDAEYLAKLIASDGEDLAATGDAAGALEAFNRALERLEGLDTTALAARFLPDPNRMLDTRLSARLNGASMATSMEQHSAAAEHAKQAHELAKRTGRPRTVGSVRAFLAVVRAAEHNVKGEHYEALAELGQARDLYKKWKFPVEHADCLRRMGTILSSLGDPVGGLEHQRQAIEELTPIGAAWTLAQAHRDAARNCITLIRAADAERHAGESLRLARGLKARGLVSEALGVRARLAFRQAQYSKALSITEGALRGLGPRQSEAAGLLRHLQAEVYTFIGDNDRALELVDMAVALHSRSVQKGNFRRSQELRASLLGKVGKHEAALELANAILREAQEQGNLVGMAWGRQRLADLHWGTGEYARAAEIRNKAVGMFLAMGNERHALEARIQAAREVFWGGKRDLGLEKMAHARSLAEKDGNPRVLAWSTVGLAEAHLAESRFPEAVHWARTGLNHFAAYGMALAEGESALARQAFAGLYATGVEAAWRAKDGDSVYEFVERSRASGLLASLGGIQALREASIPKALRVVEEEARASVAVANERLNAARRAEGLALVRERRKALDEAQARLEAAVSDIQREVRMQADLAYQGNVSVEELQRALAPDEALVLFNRVTKSHDLAVVVTRATSTATLIGKRIDIEDAVGRLAADGDEPIDPAHVVAARKLLFDGLGLGTEIKRILVSPSADLAYVPFALLDTDREIVNVPSATVYGVIRTQTPSPGTKVLAMGDPDYGVVHDAAPHTGPRLRGGRGRLAQLPATRGEVEAIGDVVLVGKNASETQFRKVVSTQERWKAVHFACHGLVDPKRPTLCSLELTADAENDGSLWALEVFRTSVPADLVVLSGCETGKGRYVRGEGIIGLVRTFMQAGAPRVIASLWNVDDDATRALMTKFYELWNPKDGSKPLPTATALRLAQEHVRNQPAWQHPRFWAAWVLWGRPD